MWQAALGLFPIFIASLVFNWSETLRLLGLSFFFGFFFEYLFAKFNGAQVNWKDGSTFFLCALFAFLLPTGVSHWAVISGIFITLVVANDCFGGREQSLFHPALAGRAAVFVLFPGETLRTLEALGGTSVLAVLIGGLYLISRRLISWRTPVIFIATLFAVSLPSGMAAAREILTGGIFLSAFFVLSDSITSPITRTGKVFYALFAAAFVCFLKQRLTLSESATYGILFMNALTPFIDRYLKPEARSHASAEI